MRMIDSAAPAGKRVSREGEAASRVRNKGSVGRRVLFGKGQGTGGDERGRARVRSGLRRRNWFREREGGLPAGRDIFLLSFFRSGLSREPCGGTGRAALVPVVQPFCLIDVC